MNYSTHEKQQCIEPKYEKLTIEKQCELVGISRSGYYYKPQTLNQETLSLINIVDKTYTEYPFFGTRKMASYLAKDGYEIGRKRIRKIYELLGLEAVYPKPKMSKKNKEHIIYPYLLRDVEIVRCNQVWSTDLTYIKLNGGFIYLMAIIDWYSRYVLDWEVSITLEADFCVETLNRVLVRYDKISEVFNTYQGSQFTSKAFTELLLKKNIQISMDGKGRALDNIFVERLWRSLKYECIYLLSLNTVKEAREAIQNYFEFYNYERPHQALRNRTPAEVYYEK